jgi:hypothetical protein
MEGLISFWGYQEQESNLILHEHDDDDDDDDDIIAQCAVLDYLKLINSQQADYIFI